MPDTISPRQIAERMAYGLQLKLQMTTAQVYVSAVGGYIEGQNQEVIQVVPNGAKVKGAGNGAQDGDGLLRDTTATLWCWFRMNFSVHQWTQEELIKHSAGILDRLEVIRAVFALTNLGGVTMEPMVYQGTSPVTVYDSDAGVLYATINYSAAIGEYLPEAATLTVEDFANFT